MTRERQRNEIKPRILKQQRTGGRRKGRSSSHRQRENKAGEQTIKRNSAKSGRYY